MPDQANFDLAVLERFLSSPRFDLYREATNDDTKKAVQLYRWNVNISSALYDPLHIFEVTLRNRIDYILTSSDFGAEWYQPYHWADHGNKREYDALKKVTDRLVGEAKNRRIADRVKYTILKRLPVGLQKDNVIAELPLSFWCNVIDPFYGKLIWNDHFFTLFPNAGGGLSVKEAHEECARLMLLRNLVAHYEPVFYLPLLRLYALLKEVTGWISEEMADWIKTCNDEKVLPLIEKKPATASVKSS